MLEALYIGRAISHFESLVTIVRPYIAPAEESIYRSKFAQIRNREGYVALVQELERIAASHRCRVEPFVAY